MLARLGILAGLCLFCALIGSAEANERKATPSQDSASIIKESSDQVWLVQPKACIVEALGDDCELSLEIIMPALEKGVYCYFANNENLQCFDSESPVSIVDVSFSENTLLSLRLVPSTNNSILPLDINNLPPPIFTQTLEIRTRTSTKQVRRVRDPWSLF